MSKKHIDDAIAAQTVYEEETGCLVWRGPLHEKGRYPIAVLPDGDWVSVKAYLFRHLKRPGHIAAFGNTCGHNTRCLRLDHNYVAGYFPKIARSDPPSSS